MSDYSDQVEEMSEDFLKAFRKIQAEKDTGLTAQNAAHVGLNIVAAAWNWNHPPVIVEED